MLCAKLIDIFECVHSLLPASILCLTRRSGGGEADPKGQNAVETSQQASPSDTLELPEESARRESTHSAKSVSIELGDQHVRTRQRSTSDAGEIEAAAGESEF